MSLTLSLNTALSGLRVNRESLAVLSQNIANANNPDYSAKKISQAAVTLDGIGAGVSIDDVTRKIDTYLQQAVRSQTSVVGRTEALSEYAERLQLLLGSPGTGGGLNNHITNVFNAMQSLAETPERSSNRVNVVNAAQNLVNEIQHIYNGLQELRFDADQEIKTSVSTVNLRLNELYTLNAAIGNAAALGNPTSELLDQRDAAIREISEHLDINIFEQPDGSVSIYARGGATLLDTNLYELEYRPISSPNALQTDDPQFSPLRTYILDSSGQRVSESVPIISGGSSDEVSTNMQQGKIRALIDMRDDNLPGVLEQIDMLTARIRDEVNAAHNAGSGFPGSASLTGTREITAGTTLNWQGNVRIALVDINGQPITSPYADETGGMRPLTIDLSTLDAGFGSGPGYPNVQSIINEINNHYGRPQNRVSLGNLNNIELTSTSQQLPAGTFNFDFDLENISGAGTDFFVTGVTVLDDTNTDITSVTNTAPSFSLNGTNTYTTVNGSPTVTIAANSHGLVNGDYVFLPEPSSAVGGIPAAELGGFFQVTNVTDNGFDIVTDASATSNATLNEAGTAIPKYFDSETGTQSRTTANGGFTADLIGNLSSSYYDISVNVATVDEDGTVSTSVVEYRVSSNTGNMYNRRYGAASASGAATLTQPTQVTQSYATARLVDANGNEVPKVNNSYLSDVPSFLDIQVNGNSYYLSIDSLDSVENGDPSAAPFVLPGSGRGFSHYFELNNFFSSNSPTNTGDTVADSARNFALESRIASNPANVSTGRLVLSSAPSEVGAPPLYTYERIAGDDSVIQQLANLANSVITFDAAGGLSATNQSIGGYAGEILGFIGSDANSLESSYENAKVILDGFVERSTAISGVNLDEELANTILYQNAYGATARVITVANELFETLLNSIG